jgi:hypothetical protein
MTHQIYYNLRACVRLRTHARMNACMYVCVGGWLVAKPPLSLCSLSLCSHCAHVLSWPILCCGVLLCCTVLRCGLFHENVCSSGADLIVTSTGAFTDDALYERLRGAACEQVGGV